jgi:hypothetical protein
MKSTVPTLPLSPTTSASAASARGSQIGATVVLTGAARIRVTANGNPISFGVRFTDVYVNKDGQWQMVAWQSTRLPE